MKLIPKALSFRPRFRWFNKYLSLLGRLVCLVVILALDINYRLVATAILADSWPGPKSLPTRRTWHN